MCQSRSVYELLLGFHTLGDDLQIQRLADRWSAQPWARNLFDKHYAVRGFYFGNEPPNFPNELYLRYGDPRQIGITFNMRF